LDLISIREANFGWLCPEIFGPLLILTQIQTTLGKISEARLSFDKGIKMCEELLKDPLTKKETPRLVPYYEEFLQLAFRCYQ
jgi:hypothetical protein